MLKNTEHGTNYNELVPADVNDFNIAKANNALADIVKETRYFHGDLIVGHTVNNLLPKIRNEAYINDGSPIHSKFTYKELAVLKYIGKDLNLEYTPGYNGIVQKGPFTNREPYNIEISQSISSNSPFGNRLETAASNYKNYVNDYLERINNQT